MGPKKYGMKSQCDFFSNKYTCDNPRKKTRRVQLFAVPIMQVSY